MDMEKNSFAFLFILTNSDGKTSKSILHVL